MSRLDKLRSQWSDKRLLLLNGVPSNSNPDTIFRLCSAADPTPTHKYVGWLLKSWDASCFHYYDICMGASSRVADQLQRFEVHKRLIPDVSLRSIMKYSSPGELDAILDSVEAPSFSSSRKQMKKETWHLGETQSLRFDIHGVNGNQCKLIIPLSELGSKVAGHGTRWCTAGDRYNAFKNYVLRLGRKDNFYPLCIIEMPSNNDDGKPLKYQFHFSADGVFSFMDARDVNVSPDFIKELDYKGFLDAIDSFLISNSFWAPDISFSHQCRLLLKTSVEKKPCPQEETSPVSGIDTSRPLNPFEKACIRGIEGAQYFRGFLIYRRFGDYQSLDFYKNEISRLVSGYNNKRYNINGLIKKISKVTSFFYDFMRYDGCSRIDFHKFIKESLDPIKFRKSDIILLCNNSFTLDIESNCFYSRYMITLLGSNMNYNEFMSCGKKVSCYHISRQYAKHPQTLRLMNSGMVDFEHLYQESKTPLICTPFYNCIYSRTGYNFDYMLMAPQSFTTETASIFIIQCLLFAIFNNNNVIPNKDVNKSLYFDKMKSDLINFLDIHGLNDYNALYKTCLYKIVEFYNTSSPSLSLANHSLNSYVGQSFLIQLLYVLFFQTDKFSDFVNNPKNFKLDSMIYKLEGYIDEPDGYSFLEVIYALYRIEKGDDLDIIRKGASVSIAITKPFLRYYFYNDKSSLLGSKFAKHDNPEIRAQYQGSVITYCLSRLMQYDKGCSLSMADRETKAPEIISRYLALDSQMEREIEGIYPGFLEKYSLSSPDFRRMVSEMKVKLSLP